MFTILGLDLPPYIRTLNIYTSWPQSDRAGTATGGDLDLPFRDFVHEWRRFLNLKSSECQSCSTKMAFFVYLGPWHYPSGCNSSLLKRSSTIKVHPKKNYEAAHLRSSTPHPENWLYSKKSTCIYLDENSHDRSIQLRRHWHSDAYGLKSPVVQRKKKAEMCYLHRRKRLKSVFGWCIQLLKV